MPLGSYWTVNIVKLASFYLPSHSNMWSSLRDEMRIRYTCVILCVHWVFVPVSAPEQVQGRREEESLSEHLLSTPRDLRHPVRQDRVWATERGEAEQDQTVSFCLHVCLRDLIASEKLCLTISKPHKTPEPRPPAWVSFSSCPVVETVPCLFVCLSVCGLLLFRPGTRSVGGRRAPPHCTRCSLRPWKRPTPRRWPSSSVRSEVTTTPQLKYILIQSQMYLYSTVSVTKQD